MSKSTTPLALLLVVFTLLTGCGYTTTELYPTDYQTVSVPYFDNRSETRAIEFNLREALIKQIEQRTPYKVLSSAGSADTVLTGTVTGVDRQLISRDSIAGLTQEVEVQITIDFEWRDRRTGETVRAYRGLTSAGQFVSNRTIGEFGDDGTRLAVQRLANEIVSRMREDAW